MMSIVGLNKLQLLKALWIAQKPAAFFAATPGRAPDWDEVEGERMLLSRKGYVDYAMGRVIKMNFSQDEVDTKYYDEMAGSGQAAKIIAALRGGAFPPRGYTAAIFVCPGQKTQRFQPFGEAMLPDKPDTIMCAHCGYWLSQHEKIYE